ncbi:amidase [Bacillus aquiflavi]|uniref:amidase n=1 Tax=Bacillus aquiflavi TaxID=2672567 RepID=UPI001CA9B38C|nr:amidase [Bacillus aquiflavi]UAC48750.1 amidase [Bacillus aquiflavi]
MKQKNVQMILDMDESELAEAIKQKKISSFEATKTYIEHLKMMNPKLNCLTEDRFDEALEEAKQMDRQIEIQQGKGRLLGVPISIKESFHVMGMKTTGGLPYRKHIVETNDAAIVANLKAEGAIILGKTNTPALCFCQETDNKLYGRTNNPWDVTRTAGGSSGGEGSLIAAGGAAVGVGSDIGGSIRFPSHFNGVVGFKSGNGQVSSEGSFPLNDIPLQKRMLGIGAIGKSVRDARNVNEIIAKAIPEKRNLQQFSVVMPIRKLYYPINSDTHSLLLHIKEKIEDHFPVSDEQPPYYTKSALLWQLIMSIDGAARIARTAFGENPPKLLREYMKEKLLKGSELHQFLTWAMIGANLFKPSSKKIAEMEATIKEGDEQLRQYFNKRLLILPIYHTAALKHGQVYHELFSIRKTYQRYIPFVAYANVWGLPALVVPVGEDENGLPIAIQIISGIGNEDAIFQFGEIIEQHFRGYKRCVF